MPSTRPDGMRDVASLLEALPYIRQFHGKTVVIKYGGAAMIAALAGTVTVKRKSAATDFFCAKAMLKPRIFISTSTVPPRDILTAIYIPIRINCNRGIFRRLIGGFPTFL